MHTEFMDDDFKKSSLCKHCSHCVAIAIKDDVVAIRDTKDPAKTTLNFTKDEWQVFLAGAKKGEFDI